MKPVTKYQANDGSVWDREDQALDRDALILTCEAEVARIGLKPRPEGDTTYSNGGGYIQQPAGARDKLLGFLKEQGANRDSTGPIGKLLWRFRAIDDRDREWGQPYFALNPDEGKQVEVSQ